MANKGSVAMLEGIVTAVVLVWMGWLTYCLIVDDDRKVIHDAAKD